MAIALVASVKSGTNSSGTTSAGIDTTGASLLVMVVGHYAAAATPTISDSKGNAWTARTSYTHDAFTRITIFYAANPTVGSAHTFTASGSNCYASICVGAFSGAATSTPYDTENGANGDASTSQPGSITPSEANCLVVAGANVYLNNISSIDSGYTLAQDQQGLAGSYFASALAYIVQTTATATNPTFTHSATGPYADTIASFKAAAAASAIKTINGLARASVKTIDGLALASVKTYNGLA